MKRWTIIFDGDDTLWACFVYYRAADAACWQVICHHWPDVPTSLSDFLPTARRVQRAMFRRRGHTRELFEDAWAECYRYLRGRSGRPVIESVVQEVRWAAGIIHDAPYVRFPGVLEMLDRLRHDGHRLYLLTLGDRETQRSKIHRNDLAQYFDGIHIVRRGKERVMRSLLHEHGPAIMVGDSMPRDIAPAKRLGLVPVWIHGDDPWMRGEKGVVDGTLTVRQATDLPELLPTIRFTAA